MLLPSHGWLEVMSERSGSGSAAAAVLRGDRVVDRAVGERTKSGWTG